MKIYDAGKVKRATVTTEETIFEFEKAQSGIDIINYGPGNVVFALDKAASFENVDNIKLKKGVAYESRPVKSVKSIHLVSDDEAEVQIEVVR
ncbi:hypothetical protein [Bacillus chungangensis]|uniref:Uncharacterized protein n=1 Tax=Bacillus chungangensis TaxID=587633 RepID=A0ABT9WTW3_9BACI|nr:hypothetical protein [Bacillus chungangensis]MDQ0176739.1 hypothetical protein [Bacillus chungangensis]